MFTLLASLALAAQPVAAAPNPCMGVCFPWVAPPRPPKPGNGPKPK